jgi:hypothetical protein
VPPPKPAELATASVDTVNGPDAAVRLASVGSGPFQSQATSINAKTAAMAARRSGMIRIEFIFPPIGVTAQAGQSLSRS